MNDPDNPSHSEVHTEPQHEQPEPVHKPEPVHVQPAPVKEAEPKKEEKEEHKGGNTFLTVAAIVQILLLIFVVFQISGMDGTVQGAAIGAPSPAAAAPRPTAPSAPTVDVEALLDDDTVKGDPDAPVTIIEWSDFECPFCARFYSQTLSQIDEQYIKTGKVKLVYRDFPLSFHANAQKSAEAAECAGEQGKYWEMHDLLFESGVAGGVPAFKRYAQQLGLNTGEFNECLDSGSMAGEVRKDMSDGQAAGVSGTPGFIVNGKLISGAQPFSVFQQAIEAELAN